MWAPAYYVTGRDLTAVRQLSARIKSEIDLTRQASREHAEQQRYPLDASAYALLDECGQGLNSMVFRAVLKSRREIVAVKKMDLDALTCDLDDIIHEAHTMKIYHHPNVLPLYCSFVSGQDLWMVMPYISAGSVLHIMKYAHPDGLDEVVIATIMRDVLKALEYVHKQGGIHRDVKAGNILLDKDGQVYLGDFGVAANLERTGSWEDEKGGRKTFAGTPCWMAPEVMEQTHEYHSSADIWSFGMTLLELAYGSAPYAKYSPMKIVMLTLRNPPPQLEDRGTRHFTKAMRDVVACCLQKDPKLRPTAAHLLEHKFFKQARDQHYLTSKLLAGLPSLQARTASQTEQVSNSSSNNLPILDDASPPHRQNTHGRAWSLTEG